MKNILTTLIAMAGALGGLTVTSQAQNLLQNGDFTSGNIGFLTDYSFVSSGTSTTPGTYGIRSSSQDFNSFYTLFGDHTTGTGLMMLVDGVPTSRVWSETASVTINTQYTFSIWAAPSDAPNPAVLQFAINGVQIGSNLTLDTTPGVWHNFSSAWSSASSTSAVISIVDVNPSGQTFGDDFAIDAASFTKVVPEPSTFALLAGGMLLLISYFRRSRQSA